MSHTPTYRLDRPLVDISSIVAVESVYRSGSGDPNRYKLAGQLGDMLAYARTVRYPLPLRSDREPAIPDLLKSLQAKDTELIRPVWFSTDDRIELASDYHDAAVQSFVSWAKAHTPTLKKTVRFQAEEWIRRGHESRVRNTYVFDVSKVAGRSDIAILARVLDASLNDLLFTFDVALRYSLYGQLANGQHYLAHPVRDAIRLPSQTEEASEPWRPCISFAADLELLARRMTQDEFVGFLHDIREQVHQFSLQTQKPGDVDREVLRAIGSKLRLPARLGNRNAVLGTAGGVLTIGALVPEMMTPMTVLGGTVGIAAAAWRGHVPRGVGQSRWLRWMVRFDVEAQIDSNNSDGAA